eukprot:2346034-Rhodomonas_salina.1
MSGWHSCRWSGGRGRLPKSNAMAFQVMLVYWGSQVASVMTEEGWSGTGGLIAAAANTAHHTVLTVRGKTMIPAAPS